jgi:hypothetical protein
LVVISIDDLDQLEQEIRDLLRLDQGIESS